MDSTYVPILAITQYSTIISKITFSLFIFWKVKFQTSEESKGTFPYNIWIMICLQNLGSLGKLILYLTENKVLTFSCWFWARGSLNLYLIRKKNMRLDKNVTILKKWLETVGSIWCKFWAKSMGHFEDVFTVFVRHFRLQLCKI